MESEDLGRRDTLTVVAVRGEPLDKIKIKHLDAYR